MSIEGFLTRKYAKAHSTRYHGIVGIVREMFSDENSLKEQFGNYAKSTESFRNDLERKLGGDREERKRAAENWSFFIKTKVPVFKFWSTLCTAFISIYGLGSAIYTLMGAATGLAPAPGVLVAFLLVGGILLVTKYLFDKRAFWYEYVLANLDVIAKSSQVASPQDMPIEQAGSQPSLLATAPATALQQTLRHQTAQRS